MNRQVFAHLCTWFHTPQVSGDWRMWNSEHPQAPHDPEYRQYDGRRDIATVDYPLTDVYDSTDPDLINFQLELMKLVGIDGVIVDWDGTRLNRYRHEALLALLPHLERHGMSLIICYEEACGYLPIGAFADREAERAAALHDARYLADSLMSRPCYAQLRGHKPVLVFRKRPEKWFSPQEWPPLRQAMTDAGGAVIFPSHGSEPFAPVIDGRYFWVGGFDPDSRFNSLDQIRDRYGDFLAGVPDWGSQLQPPLVFGSVVPGFDDTPVWGWGQQPRVAPRYRGERYRLMWEMSIAAEVDAVQIVTWNDWNEGSHIEPSTAFGFEYLKLTKQYAARYKGQPDRVPDAELEKPLQRYLDRARS